MPADDFSDVMGRALDLARQAGAAGDVPVGAVLLDTDGKIVASDRNKVEEQRDPTAHAEMLVIRRRAAELGETRLAGHTLVVTLEPCPMCAMAAVWARLDRIVYGAADPKAGAAWTLFNIPQDERLNHRCDLVAGVRAEECGDLLTEFFEERRRP
jgi:tRNA(adenine34) deaminase